MTKIIARKSSTNSWIQEVSFFEEAEGRLNNVGGIVERKTKDTGKIFYETYTCLLTGMVGYYESLEAAKNRIIADLDYKHKKNDSLLEAVKGILF